MLPAGPTIVDVLANAAFYYGAMRMLAHEDRPVWTKMSFAACEENFRRAARDGIDARLYWPGFGELSADELALRHLLPLAHEGLRLWGVSDAVRERYLGVVEGRCTTGRQRRRVVDPRGRAPSRTRAATAARRCAGCSSSMPCTWTPTSRCTPGRCPDRPRRRRPRG